MPTRLAHLVLSFRLLYGPAGRYFAVSSSSSITSHATSEICISCCKQDLDARDVLPLADSVI